MSSRMLLVSGTGRSGTSITAEMLSRLGVKMLHDHGLQVAGGPNESNPTGTWEDKELSDLTARWSRGDRKRRGEVESMVLEACRARSRSWPSWGFKDPRITESGELWENIWDLLLMDGLVGGAPLLVLCHRERAAVERSLARAYGLPQGIMETWMGRRLENLERLTAIWEARSWPIFRVDFRELVGTPMAVAGEAYDQLVDHGHMAGIEGHLRLARPISCVDHIEARHVRSGVA